MAHEALLREWPRLRGWLDEDAQGRRLQAHLREAARGWADTRTRSERALPRRAVGRDPGMGRPGMTESSTPPSATFLAAGRAASQRSQRRLRAVVAGLGVLLLLALAAGAVALDQRATARAEATAAEAQRLGARALVEDDLDLSLLLASQGSRS